MSFIFGGNTGLTYEQLQQRRKALEARKGTQYRARTAGDGLAALGHALGTRLESGRLAKAETARRGRADEAFSAFQTILGGGYNPPSQQGAFEPAASNIPSTTSAAPNVSFDGDVKSGIMATARSLGVDPVDLATAISYETAGTFDPTKRGPTTQWGQHRGLIQFGEPQAKKYGVNWDNPIGSQLGPDGAVAKYLRDTGVKPGMGLLDIYSAINAGGVGLYNRSDANNGGAPGTVRDKVEKQMAGHRAKALAMFSDNQVASADANRAFQAVLGRQGGQPQQQPVQVAQAQPQQRAGNQQRGNPFGGVDPRLIDLMGNPDISPQRRSAMQFLLQQHLKANAPVDPLKQLQLEKAQIELERLRNPQADPMKELQLQKMQLELQQMQNPDRSIIEGADGFKYYQDTGERVLPNVQQTPEPGYQMLSPDQVQQMGLPEGNYQRGPKGRISQVGGGGTNVTVNNGPSVPEYNKLPAGYVYKRDLQGNIIIDEDGVPTAAPIVGGPAALEAEKRAASQQAAQELKERGGGVVLEDIDRAIGIIENGGMLNGTGLSGRLTQGIPGTDAFALNKLLDTVKANSGFDKLQQMRDASPTGGALGQVSERELNFLQSAIGSLDQAQDQETLTHNLNRVKRIYQDIVHGPSQTGSDVSLDDLLKKYGGQ